MNAMSQITLRLPEDLHTKLRIIAAFKNQSINMLATEGLQELVAQWEQKYGIVKAPQDE